MLLFQLYKPCIPLGLTKLTYMWTDICHSSVKYLQIICTKVSVTYLRHIGIWPHNISVTVM
jgi:hypothetical protein